MREDAVAAGGSEGEGSGGEVGPGVGKLMEGQGRRRTALDAW